MRGVAITLSRFVLLSAALLAPEAAARGSNVHTFTQNTDVWDGNGGPWLTGHVYLLKAVVTVPQTQVLTIQPGAIVKFDSTRYLTIYGQLTAIGTSGSPIWFTSLKDDSVGGDHNGDGGSTTPAKGDYRKIDIPHYSSGSTMQWCRVRYGGYFGGPAVDCGSSTFTMTDCVIEDCSGPGLDLTVSSGPIERNAFDRCKRPITGLTPKWLHTLRDNTASGNVDGDVMVVDAAGAFGTDLTVDTNWSPANSLNGSGEIAMYRKIKVILNKTLTIEAGTELLFTTAADAINVSGTLLTNGTASDPVVLTSVGDPDFGGVGAAPGDWVGVTVTGSDATTLVHTEVRYAGTSGGAVRLSGSDATLTNCRIADSASDGLDAGAANHPIVTGCAFDSNATYAISPVPIDVLAGFSGNTASGNGNGDAIALGSGSLSAAFTLGPAAAFNGTGAFILANSVTIAATGSLTLDPGVTLKADPSGNPAVTVHGTLVCNGTPVEPVTFTSLYDDSVGGDLNADGSATTPAPGDWQSLKFYQQADASSLKNTRVRYGGRNGTRSLYLDGADITLTDCVLEHGDGAGLEAKSSAPTVTGCAFDFCSDAPIIELPLESLSGLSANTAQGNGNGNSIRFAASGVDIAVTVKKTNSLNDDGVFVFDGSLNVSGTGDLTLDPGVTLKFVADQFLTVTGTLTAIGTDLERIALTSIGDDTFGGDTDGNGPTTGQPGDWRGIAIFLAQDIDLRYTTIRNAGSADKPAIELNGGALTMDHVVVEDSAAMGFRQVGFSGLPLVTNSSFDRCTRPVYGVSIATLQGWSGNTAQGNSLGDTLRFFHTGSGALSVALSTTESLNGSGAFESVGYWNINNNQTVTIEKGVTIKVVHAQPIAVHGTLITLGTANEPVCFTSRYDDTYGGDSNGDGGATTPAPGDWAGLAFTSDASVLNDTVIRYAGLGGAAGIDLQNADITLCNVTIENCAAAGIDANGNSAPTLKNVSIDDNGGQAVEGVTWGILGKMSGASASGNQGGDYTYIDSPDIGGDLTIHQESVLGSCIVVNVTPNTNTGSLTFGRGVIVKATGPHVEMRVKDVLGTGLEKVVFTSFHDDEHGGDTNQASTAPAPGDWKGVNATGMVEHALIRYAGADIPGILAETGLRGAGGGCVGTRVDFSAADGFIITSIGSGLVAFQNAGVGIRGPGAWASTAYGNGSYGFAGGFVPDGGGICSAYGCISWMNGPNLTENYAYSADQSAGPPGVDVVWSCGTTLGIMPPTGFGGVNCGSTGWGNIYADPRFVNAPAGDLRLKADSPCRNYVRVPCPVSVLDDPSTCNPWYSSNFYPGIPEASRDHLDMPRSVDDDLLGPAPKLGDLGAYERPVFTLVPIGEPVIGTVVQLHCVGPAGTAVYLLGFEGTDAYLGGYGFLCFDPSFILTLTALPVGTPLPLPIIDSPLLEGLEVSIQAGVQEASGALEMTNVYRPRFHR